LLGEDARPLSEKDVEIISMTLERSTSEQIAALEKQVVFLATTANASPFLGLLGTVVGVMDAFWSIGERGSASLAVVAPGIAEALLATIVGLGRPFRLSSDTIGPRVESRDISIMPPTLRLNLKRALKRICLNEKTGIQGDGRD